MAVGIKLMGTVGKSSCRGARFWFRCKQHQEPTEEIGSSVGRAHNWDAGGSRFESHEIQPGDFSTAMQTDMPDIECRIMSSVSPTYSLFSRWEK